MSEPDPPPEAAIETTKPVRLPARALAWTALVGAVGLALSAAFSALRRRS